MTTKQDTRAAARRGGLDALTCRKLSHARVFFAGSSAPTILFIHGAFHGAWCWTNVLAFLAARGVGAAAIDLRGHGGLPQSRSFIAAGMDDMVADVVEAARKMPGRLVLAGHSLGALIAKKAAEKIAPRGLILLAPAAPAGVGRSHALPHFPMDRAIQPPDEMRARKWFLSGGTTADVASYVAKLCPESPKLLIECFHQGVSIEPDRVPRPLLCLSGGMDDSPLHPAGQDQVIAAHYGAWLQIIPASGHCMMLDDGAHDTAAAIHAWLGALPNT